jgi:hypothetical protein
MDYPLGKQVVVYGRTIYSGKGKEAVEDEPLEAEKTVPEEEEGKAGEPGENQRKVEREVEERKEEKKRRHCVRSSVSRTKNRVFQIARSNDDWQWFITLTFDRETTDASDYGAVTHRLRKFLENLRYRKCPDLKYLIVPELHSDGVNYHFHGLLSGCAGMDFVDSGKKGDRGEAIYNIKNWGYGFTTATEVKDIERVMAYMGKYITKESEKLLKFKHRFYASQNTEKVEPVLALLYDEESFVGEFRGFIKYVKRIKADRPLLMVTKYEMSNIPIFVLV